MKNLRSKIMLLLLLTMLIPLLIVIAWNGVTSSRAMQQKVSTASAAAGKTIVQSIDSELRRLLAEMEMTTASKEFQHAFNLLASAPTVGTEWVVGQELQKMMLGIFAHSPSVTGIYLTVPNGKSYAIEDDYRLSMSNFQENTWFQNEENNMGSLVQCGLQKFSDRQEAIVFGKVVRDVTDRASLAVLGSVHFMIDPILFRSLTTEEEGVTLLLLDNKHGIVAQRGELVEEAISHLSQTAYTGDGSMEIELDNRHCVLLYDTSSWYGYQLYRILPSEIYTKEVLNTIHRTLQFTGICVPIVILISLMMSSSLSKPVARLNKAMQYTENGNFDIYLPSSRKDEIGQVTRRFNGMVKRLGEVFEQSIQDEKKKKELEISALQYQINPHFIYNLLASIRSLALVEDAMETSEMLSAAAKLLKSTLGHTDMLLTLREELDNIEQFLYIQNLCHNGALRWQYRVEESLLDLVVPNLILQPIVENAIFYGRNPESGISSITVCALLEEDFLVLRIQDTGVGIDEEKQQEILSDHPNKGFTHVGLRNIDERIKLTFGRVYGLSFDRTEQEFSVSIRLPRRSAVSPNEMVLEERNGTEHERHAGG